MFIEQEDQATATVYVDQITTSGSGFGAKMDTGDVVFLNSRIMHAVKIQIGDTVRAIVIPNYEDKRHSVQWRAIRAVVVSDPVNETITAVEEIESTVQPAPAVEKDLSEWLCDLLDEHGPLRAATLARLMDQSVPEINVLCRGLHASGAISRAEVYSLPTNKRASHKVWALSLNDFDIDPFEDSAEVEADYESED